MGKKQTNLCPLFLEQMETELKNNSHKGDWKSWLPSPSDLMSELAHHSRKLEKAIYDNNPELVREYSADIANLAERSFVVFGDVNNG